MAHGGIADEAELRRPISALAPYLRELGSRTLETYAKAGILDAIPDDVLPIADALFKRRDDGFTYHPHGAVYLNITREGELQLALPRGAVPLHEGITKYMQLAREPDLADASALDGATEWFPPPRLFSLSKPPGFTSNRLPPADALISPRATNRFDGPVYLVNGDSHVYAENQPLAEGSPWLTVYGQNAADDLQRITVDGSANATNYVRFTVAGNGATGADILTWEKVPFGGWQQRRADDGGTSRRRPSTSIELLATEIMPAVNRELGVGAA